MDDVFHVPPGTCPTCGHTHDRATLAVNGSLDDTAPRPGDLSICATCLSVNVFQDGGALRPARVEEIADVPAWLQALVLSRAQPRH